MPSSVLSRLIYASRWSDPRGADADEMLGDIVSRSIQNNRQSDITGLLLFRDGWFLQILEGDLDQVDETFDRIRRDRRHIDVRVVCDEAADRRAFPDWNMVATPLDILAPEALQSLHLSDSFDPAQLSPGVALKLMVTAGAAEREREREGAVGGSA